LTGQQKKGILIEDSLFTTAVALTLLLNQSVDQLGEAGNVPGSIRGVNDPFGCRSVDDGNRKGKSSAGGCLILGCHSFADALYEGTQGGADMLVAVRSLLRLLDPFDCRFVICQTAPPVYFK
jgi:hypothetical protein